MRRRLQESRAILMIVLPTIGVVTRIMFPDPRDSVRLGSAANVAVAAAALFPAFLTWRSVESSRRQRASQRRPILIPQSPLWRPKIPEKSGFSFTMSGPERPRRSAAS